jgi:hypothetical protein
LTERRRAEGRRGPGIGATSDSRFGAARLALPRRGAAAVLRGVEAGVLFFKSVKRFTSAAAAPATSLTATVAMLRNERSRRTDAPRLKWSTLFLKYF